MVSRGFVGCTIGCLAGGEIDPNAAMLCLFSCYLVEIREDDGGEDGDNGDAPAGGGPNASSDAEPGAGTRTDP